MPVIYKTFTKSDLSNKATYSTSETQNQKANTIVYKFTQLFKAKHLG